jgi:hypothetical protein
MTRDNIAPRLRHRATIGGRVVFKWNLRNLAKSTDAKSSGTENNLAQLLRCDRRISFYLWIEIEGSVTFASLGESMAAYGCDAHGAGIYPRPDRVKSTV